MWVADGRMLNSLLSLFLVHTVDHFANEAWFSSDMQERFIRCKMHFCILTPYYIAVVVCCINNVFGAVYLLLHSFVSSDLVTTVLHERLEQSR